MRGLYWVASDMQNVESEVCFYDIFEKQELFDIWQIHNYKNYVCDGPSPMTNGLMLANAKSLVENIMDQQTRRLPPVQTRPLSASDTTVMLFLW